MLFHYWSDFLFSIYNSYLNDINFLHKKGTLIIWYKILKYLNKSYFYLCTDRKKDDIVFTSTQFYVIPGWGKNNFVFSNRWFCSRISRIILTQLSRTIQLLKDSSLQKNSRYNGSVICIIDQKLSRFKNRDSTRSFSLHLALLLSKREKCGAGSL